MWRCLQKYLLGVKRAIVHMPCHFMPCHFMPYYVITYHAIYHTKSCQSILHILCPAMPCRTHAISYYLITLLAISYQVMSNYVKYRELLYTCHSMPCHTAPFHAILCHNIPYHIRPSHVILCYMYHVQSCQFIP